MVALRYRRERSAYQKLAARHNWTVSLRQRKDWGPRLAGASLMHVGHTHRFGQGYRTEDGVWLLPYVFETGFEHRRNTHPWRVAVCEVEHGCARALVSREAWLLAAASAPYTTRIALDHSDPDPGSASGIVAVVEDHEAWTALLGTALRDWFSQQKAERSWEIVSGLIIGYEPGGFREADMAALAESVNELAALLATEKTHQT